MAGSFDASAGGGTNRLRVLESFGEPRPTTNPYIVQLARVLEAEPACELLPFSFRAAIIGSYDVFHVHWPEVIYTGRSRTKGIVRELLTALVLLRVQLGGKALVRTRHNLKPHTALTRPQQFLDSWFDRLTTVNICLNDATPASVQQPTVTIPHGHYRDWFAPHPVEAQIPGRIAYFGLIRHYKGVEDLISAFQHVRVPGLTLSVSGIPENPALADTLIRLAHGSEQIVFTFKYLPDEELVQAVTAAEMIVLPYHSMHNSGAALAALSLNRPVLVPETEVNRRLAHEVGPGWVHCFTEPLTTTTIESAIKGHRACPPLNAPNLSARTWRETGAGHMGAFEGAVAQKKQESAGRNRFHVAESASG